MCLYCTSTKEEKRSSSSSSSSSHQIGQIRQNFSGISRRLSRPQRTNGAFSFRAVPFSPSSLILSSLSQPRRTSTNESINRRQIPDAGIRSGRHNTGSGLRWSGLVLLRVDRNARRTAGGYIIQLISTLLVSAE